jgi:CRISPR-associated protein Cas1
MQLLNTLYVTAPESCLRLDNETVRVDADGQTRLRVPLHHLETVVCFGHVSVTTPLMHKMADDGIALVLLDTNGRFKARLEGGVAGNVLLRRAQFEASADRARSLAIARCIVAGKIRNQRHVLQRGARDAKSVGDAAALDRAAMNLAASLRALPAAGDIDVVRGLEGEAAREYFGAFAHLVRADRRGAFVPDGRTRRPPRDRTNALLSFLYAMWMNDCRSACETAGLDPQVGFLHAVRPGRASLALDLMEEFRPFADRLALTLINRGQVAEADFDVREGGSVSMTADGRKAAVVAYQERKRDELTHPLYEQGVALGLIPLIQARLLARFVRSEAGEYVPYRLG